MPEDDYLPNVKHIVAPRIQHHVTYEEGPDGIAEGSVWGF
jgi:hypothetical protein